MKKQRASNPKDPSHPAEERGSRLAAARPGDWRAELDAFYRENEDAVWAMLVAARVRDPEVVLQDVFLELAEKMAGGEAITKVRGLMGVILWHRIGKERRWLRRHPPNEIDVYTLPARRPDPEQALAMSRQKRALGEAFDALPEKARALVEEIDLDGTPPAEIAKRTGAEPSTVRSDATRARRLLRELFLRKHGKDRGD